MRIIDIQKLHENIMDIELIEKGDILIEKRGKPFAVILEYSEYIKMSTKNSLSLDDKIELLTNLENSLNLQGLKRKNIV